MNGLDWLIVATYLVGLMGMGLFLGRGQEDMDDYYLAGGAVPWWQAGLSTMATQLSAVSFVSAPAFVALKKGGGLKWLANEFAVPLGMLIVMGILIPTLHRARVISIYEYLEKRFDPGSRALISVLFQLGRGLGTAVGVLAGGEVVATALNIDINSAIIGMGAVTIVYDMFGGMKGVIISDVIQMGFIGVGIILCGVVALNIVGWDGAFSTLPTERLQVVAFDHLGLQKGQDYGFWPITIGGIFLYASYYGCDQSQVQRELSVGNVEGIRKSLLLNAMGRFPIVLAYCTMGVIVGAVAHSPEYFQRVAEALFGNSGAVDQARQLLDRHPDRMVPLFILTYLPHGVIGFLFVAILSALMSSLDSALNSLSAVTVQDVYQRYIRADASGRHYLIVSKIFTVGWGLFCVGGALIFAAQGEATRSTTLVLINAIGSILYGPILAVFLLGMLTEWAGPRSVKVGALAGVASTLLLRQLTEISWLWWNFTGCATTIIVALAVSPFDRGHTSQLALQPAEPEKLPWRAIYALVLAYFAAMVLACFGIQP